MLLKDILGAKKGWPTRSGSRFLPAAAASNTPARDDFEGFTWSLYQFGKTITADTIPALLGELAGLLTQGGGMAAGLRRLDKAWAPIAAYVPFTALQNITGQPAISLPLALSKAGLPIGVQFVGRFGEEHLLLQICGADRKG
jgi:amidase